MGGITGQQLDIATSTSGYFGAASGAGSTLGGAGAGGGFGYATFVIGAITQAVGAHYSLQIARERLKDQASHLRFVESEAGRNARIAEGDAQLALEAGQREIGRLTLGVGVAKAAKRAQAAASGLRLNAGGSVARTEASLELVKQMDVLAIRRNAARAAGAARTRSTNFRNEGLLAGVSAQNVSRSANAIDPAFGAAVALSENAGAAATHISRDRRLASYLQTI